MPKSLVPDANSIGLLMWFENNKKHTRILTREEAIKKVVGKAFKSMVVNGKIHYDAIFLEEDIPARGMRVNLNDEIKLTK